MESEGREPNPGDNSGDDGREAIITTFREITSATREEAIFFLEYHQFDLDAAVSSILDEVVTTTAAIYNNNNNNANDGNENVHDNTGDVLGHSPPSGPESPEYHPSPSRSRSPSPSSSRGPYELRSRRENKLKKKKRGRKDDGPSHGRRSTRNNVRTLSDLKRRARDDSSSDDSDEPPEYYTGGEKSGMLVQDRTRGSETDAIFRRAKQVAIDPADHDGRSSRSKSFTGTARLLSGETVSASPVPPEVVTHTITFWRNGFSVDDGPLRRFDDPENASFMESIKESECPGELEPADSRTSVHVDLERRDENYPESKKSLKQNVPFQGVGRTIGSSSSSNPDVTEPAAPTSLNAASLPSTGLVVDESSPSTSIQLRLADGTRMITRFNHHHTIRDIRDFIDASRPGGSGTYQLLRMGFPPKQLADLDQTIEQAGVANSVVIQKF